MRLLGNAAFAIVVTVNASFFSATAEAKKCKYHLTPAGEEVGEARVEYEPKKNELKIDFKAAFRETMYTIWIDFRNRASGELPSDYPLALGALERGVAPAFATDAGTTNGITLDPNALITDDKGKAKFKVKLDYDILARSSSPVVGEDLAMQGESRVGGNWLRLFERDPMTEASLQVVDPNTGLPILPRSTAQGITVVRHPDFVSHGHTPGVSGVDHVPAFQGDFPYHCF